MCFSITAIALEKLQNSTGTVINPATSDNQTNGSQKTVVTSGTVTANIGTAGTLATELTLTAISANIATMLGNQTDGDQVVIAKGNKTPSDTFANPTTAQDTWALLGGWVTANSQWARIFARQYGSDALNDTTDYMLQSRAHLIVLDGTNSVRLTGTVLNGLDVDVTRQATSFGKTILYTSISQVSAGTTTIAVASASNKHKVVGVTLSMDAAGTLKFSDSSGDLTGAMPMSANVPYTLSTSLIPYFQTGAVNRLISLTTTTGKAFGVVQYVTEP